MMLAQDGQLARRKAERGIGDGDARHLRWNDVGNVKALIRGPLSGRWRKRTRSACQQVRVEGTSRVKVDSVAEVEDA